VAHVTRHADLIDGPPEVVPMTGGRLQLEWVAGSRGLELEFTDPETIHYLATEDGYDPDEDIYRIDDAWMGRRSFDWLFGRLGDMQ
jgi:hypothetical protein